MKLNVIGLCGCGCAKGTCLYVCVLLLTHSDMECTTNVKVKLKRRCPRRDEGQCKFFKWADEVEQQPQQPAQPSPGEPPALLQFAIDMKRIICMRISQSYCSCWRLIQCQHVYQQDVLQHCSTCISAHRVGLGNIARHAEPHAETDCLC